MPAKRSSKTKARHSAACRTNPDTTQAKVEKLKIGLVARRRLCERSWFQSRCSEQSFHETPNASAAAVRRFGGCALSF